MDPRDRERAERRLVASLPGPKDPPQELDPDTARRLAWFIRNRKQIMEEMALADVEVTTDGVRAVHKPIAPALTVVCA